MFRVAYFQPVDGRTEIFVDTFPPEAVHWNLDHAREAGLICWMCGWDWRQGMRDDNVPYRLQGPDGLPRTACRPCHTRDPELAEELDALPGPALLPGPARIDEPTEPGPGDRPVATGRTAGPGDRPGATVPTTRAAAHATPGLPDEAGGATPRGTTGRPGRHLISALAKY